MIEFFEGKVPKSDTNLCKRMLCKPTCSSTEGHNLAHSLKSKEIFLCPLFPKQFNGSVKCADVAKCTTKTSLLPHTVGVKKEFKREGTKTKFRTNNAKFSYYSYMYSKSVLHILCKKYKKNKRPRRFICCVHYFYIL